MSMMTHTALSDCSYPESTAYNIRDEINATITRLKVVINKEATLRKALRTLFVTRREEAIEQVRLANIHLDLVNEEETAFCDDLIRAKASANEEFDGPGSLDNVTKVELAPPSFIPTPADPTRRHATAPKLDATDIGSIREPIISTEHDACDGTAPPQSPVRSKVGLDNKVLPRSPTGSPVGLPNDPPRLPARSTHSFHSPRSPARYTHGFVDDPVKPPTIFAPEPLKERSQSPAGPTRALLDEPPRSPSQSSIYIHEPRALARDQAKKETPPPVSLGDWKAMGPDCNPEVAARRAEQALLDLVGEEPEEEAIEGSGNTKGNGRKTALVDLDTVRIMEPDEDPEERRRRAEQALIDLVGEEPKKAAVPKKTKGKTKKGSTKAIEMTPDDFIPSCADEEPPQTVANSPEWPGATEEYAAEDGDDDFFAGVLAKNERVTTPKLTPAMKKKAARLKKLSIRAEEKPSHAVDSLEATLLPPDCSDDLLEYWLAEETDPLTAQLIMPTTSSKKKKGWADLLSGEFSLISPSIL